jgi:hypothetical protein
MQDEITKALGLPDLPPAQFERARKLILEDNFFYSRCLSTLVLGVAGRVAESLHPLERERMRRISGVAMLARGTAAWGIVDNELNGKFKLKASCAVCKQDVSFTPPEAWREHKYVDRGNGDIWDNFKDHPVTKDDIKANLEGLRWNHCGHLEKPPADILLVWQDRLAALISRP